MAEPNSLDTEEKPVAPQQPQLVQGGATLSSPQSVPERSSSNAASLFGGSTNELLESLGRDMPAAYAQSKAAKNAAIATIDKAAKEREVKDLKTRNDELREADKIINSRDTTLRTKIPPAPSPKFGDPFEGGGSMLMFLGAIASLGARRPLTTAMGAMGSYLEGFQHGDKERIDLEWKRYEAALKVADREMDKEIAGINYGLKKDGMSLAARNAYFTAEFAASGNKYAADVLKAKGLEGLGDLSLDYYKAKEHLAEFKIQQEQTNAYRMANLDLQRQKFVSGQMDDASIDNAVEGWLAGNTAVTSTMGSGAVRSYNMARFNERMAVRMREKGMTGADVASQKAIFQGVQASERAVGTRAGNVELAVQEAKNTAPLLLEASKKVWRTNFVPLNKVFELVKEGTSNPDMIEFHDFNESFINIYSRGTVGSGAMTVQQVDRSIKMLMTATGAEGYQRALETMVRELLVAEHSVAPARQALVGQHTPFILGGKEITVGGEPSAAPAASTEGWSIKRLD